MQLGVSQLATLAITQLPHTPALPTFLDPTNVPEAAQRFKSREPGTNFQQVVGLPITPWDRLDPPSFELSIRPNRRINDPQPQIVVGLPITPWDRLVPNYSEQVKHKPRLAPELTAYQIVNQPITPWDRIWPSFVDPGFKPKSRINDPQPQIIVGLPITPNRLTPNYSDLILQRRKIYELPVFNTSTGTPTPAQLTPINIDQGLRPKTRINDPQTYLQVGLPITPASLTSVNLEAPFHRRRDFHQPAYPVVISTINYSQPIYLDIRPSQRHYQDSSIAIVSLRTPTPSTLSPVPIDQGIKFKYRINDPQPQIVVGLPITPFVLTPNYSEQVKSRLRINDPQPQIIVGLPITSAALSPNYSEQVRYRPRVPDPSSFSISTIPTPTPTALTPDYFDNALKFKYRVSDPQTFLQVGLPVTPSALSPPFFDTLAPIRKFVEPNSFPFQAAAQQIVIAQIQQIDRPIRREIIAYQAVIYPTISYYPLPSALDIYRPRLVLGEVSVSIAPPTQSANTVLFPDYNFIDIRKQGSQDGILTIGSVILPPPIVARNIDRFIIRSRRRMRR